MRSHPKATPVFPKRHFPCPQHAQLPRQFFVAGASANLGKVLLLDTATGELRIGGAQEHLPAAPPGDHATLRWLEEWARRLDAGWYRAAHIGVHPRRRTLGVSLFPAAPPAMAEAVTRGLRVRVSAVFAPEMCGAEGGARYFFAYSVRFRLLAAGEQQQQQALGQLAQQQGQPEERQEGQEQAGAMAVDGNGSDPAAGSPEQQQHQQQQHDERPPSGAADTAAAAAAAAGPSSSSGSDGAARPAAVLRRCQLESRHWRILDAGAALASEVSGEGVVGEFPLLEAGGAEFDYQSCTHQAERLGFMEGRFRFVEGSLARPEGAAFDAACPRFELRVPDFIY